MPAKASPRQLKNRARTVAKLLGSKPPVNLAFNFINFQSYKYQFLATNIRHPTQVFILDKFILLSQVFITRHGTEWFFHSQSQLQDSLGMSPKTIKKVADILVAKKVLLRKRASRTGKTFYKLQYSALMSCYQNFLNPDLLGDKAIRDRVYVARLRYFAHMAKFCRLLHAKLEDDKVQPTIKARPQKSDNEAKSATYSSRVQRFIADDLDDDLNGELDADEYDYALDPDNYDAYPTRPRPLMTVEEKVARMMEFFPDLSEAQARKQLRHL